MIRVAYSRDVWSGRAFRDELRDHHGVDWYDPDARSCLLELVNDGVLERTLGGTIRATK